MPRIDPAQLLNCLQVLLSPTGGILSEDEVHRLASLMTKFSKKLVSKCVYVLILKNTDRHLLHLFMGCGGWSLVQVWINDAMFNLNWVLVRELLELLILTPVDVERLKSNNIPKLVKGLSKRDDLNEVSTLASQLVQLWLKIVKDETQSEQQRLIQAAASSNEAAQNSSDEVTEEPNVSNEPEISTKAFYKLSLKLSKDAALANAKSESNLDESVKDGDNEQSEELHKEHDKDKAKDDKKKHEKSKHRSSSSSSKSSKSSSHKDRHSSSSSSSSKSKDKDKSKTKDKHHSSHDKNKDKDRHRSNGSVSSSSSSSKSSKSSSHKKDKDKSESKDKQVEKDKETSHVVQPLDIHKLPKIPKKSADDKNKDAKAEALKGSISIEVRKTTEERPKTVKVYKSKMRSTGLEEEAKPAPPRSSKKPSIPNPLPPPSSAASVKRPSPIRDTTGIPPEKKSKIEVPVERPGSIKLIPPKPKPTVLQESDMFMDALTAATTKKEPKKRKRRASSSKEPGATSPPHSPTSTSVPTATSPIGIKNIVAPKFYQDTLQSDDSKPQADNDGENKEANANPDYPDEPMEVTGRCTTPVEEADDAHEVRLNEHGLKSVLVYTRRKGPKKSIKWKEDSELVDVRYFELDESERVNVTRAFGDMAKMDVRSEREALQMSRKLQNEDVMDIQTVWKVPTEIDIPPALVVPGSKSFERDIQFAREKTILQALYFNKRALPDSPAEPDPENYQIKDPIYIPTEDTDNPDHDFRKKPWPEPKGSPPRVVPQNNPPPIFHNPPPANFQNMPLQPQPNFPPMQPNIPPQMQFPNPQAHFIRPPQNMPGPEWNARNMQPMMPPNMQPQELVNPMMNNPYIPTQEHFNPVNEVNHRFPGPFVQQGPPPGLFQQNNFRGPARGRGNFGNFRRNGGGGGGGGAWMRMNGPPQKNWHNNQRGHFRRGGGGGGGNFDNRGYTGNADMY